MTATGLYLRALAAACVHERAAGGDAEDRRACDRVGVAGERSMVTLTIRQREGT
jgi:hypothetical protein